MVNYEIRSTDEFPHLQELGFRWALVRIINDQVEEIISWSGKGHEKKRLETLMKEFRKQPSYQRCRGKYPKCPR
jgi:hypothetical protein